ncbi:hypothetical protein SK128_013647, partial [Halocaridina rubra]
SGNQEYPDRRPRLQRLRLYFPRCHLCCVCHLQLVSTIMSQCIGPQTNHDRWRHFLC